LVHNHTFIDQFKIETPDSRMAHTLKANIVTCISEATPASIPWTSMRHKSPDLVEIAVVGSPGVRWRFHAKQ